MATSAAPATARAARSALRGAGPIAAAGLVANLANVVVTLGIARLLSTRGYGALAQLVAVFFVLSMPGSALLIGVVRRVTTWERAGRAREVDGWAARTHRRGLAVVLPLVALAWVLRPELARALNLPGDSAIAETVTAGLLWALLCVDRGLLQARHAYRPLARNLLVEGLSRSLTTLLLVAMGLGVEGAGLALVVSVLASEADARHSLARRRRLPADTTAAPQPRSSTATPEHTRRSLTRDVAAALGALALIGILQNLDVVVLGREAPSHSGSYAAVSVATKSLVLAAVVLAGFLLPEAAARRLAGGHALHQLAATLAIVAVPAAVLLLLAASAPHTLLSVAFGPRLATASPALLPLAAAMTCLAATVLFSHYLLAVGRARVVAVLAAGTVAAAVCLPLAHGAPAATARADLACQAALALATGALVLRVARAPRRVGYVSP